MMRRLSVMAALWALLLLAAGCSSEATGDPDRGVGDLGADQAVDTGADTGTDTRVDVAVESGSPDTVKPDSGIVSAWKVVPSVAGAVIHDIAGFGSDLFAVGNGGLIMRYDGASWSTETTPYAGKQGLRSLYNTGQHLFAVGEGIDLHHDGKTWNKGAATTYLLEDIWASSSGTYLWAVEQSSSTYNTYVRYRTKASPSSYWASSATNIAKGLSMYGIYAASDSEIYVVGEACTILKCSGTCNNYFGQWKQMTAPSGCAADLKGIWALSKTDIFAVGLNGTILRYDGTSWKQMTSGTSSYLQAVWGSSKSDVYAVGHPIFNKDESIVHYDGSTWKKMPPPKTTKLNTVWGSSKSDVWVGGESILHYDGAKVP